MKFKSNYRSLFKAFGYPLKPSHGLPASVISKAEKRLGIKVPAALRDYYLVAGRERRFNQCHNRLLPPSEWFIDKKQLIFMVENQGVVYWGMSTANPSAKDPPVYTSVNDDVLTWYREHTKTSGFLAFMLHYQAVGGGFRWQRSDAAPSKYRPKDHGWKSYGEINNQFAYCRKEQVIFLAPSSAPWMPAWMLMAGAKTKEGLKRLEDELGWEES